MKRAKMVLGLLFIVLMVILLSGCVKTVEQTVVLNLFAERTLALQKTFSNVYWQSSDTTIVIVDQTGKIKTFKPGKADITASVQGKPVEIFHLSIEIIPVTDMQITPSEITLELDESAILTYALSPADASDYEIEWSSSDTKIATVDKNGKVDANRPGIALISCTAPSGVSKSCEVTVTEIMAKEITLGMTELSIEQGEQKTVSYNVFPESAAAHEVTWTSSDETIAEVDAEGTITAKKPGHCTVSVQVDTRVAQVEVTVTEMTAKEITPELTVLSLEQDEQQTIGFTVTPESAASHKATWTSSDESIATVSEDGTITALKPGQCILSVQVDTQIAMIEMTVTEITAKSITLDMTELTLDLEGQATVDISVLPETAASHKTSWLSSDESVATVSSDGTIKAVGTGQCTVSVRVDDQTAQIQVKVTNLSSREREIAGKWIGTIYRLRGETSLATDIYLWLYEDKTGVLEVGDDRFDIVSWFFVLDTTSDDGRLLSGYNIVSKGFGTWTVLKTETKFAVSISDDCLILFER